MAKLYNLARENTNTTGTGPVTLTGAVTSYLTFAQAGVQDGDYISYGIHTSTDTEVGIGVYSSTGPTLTRTTVLRSTNSNAAINITSAAQVYIPALKEDIKTVYRPEDYGAKADGATDDTAAIQAAITAASNEGGGRVVFGAKGYLFTSTLFISHYGITLEGEGKFSTVLTFVPTADDIAIDISNGSGIVNFTQLRGFHLYSPDTTFTKTGIKATDVDFFEMDQVSIGGAFGGSQWGGGTGSTALHINGRDFIEVRETCQFAAQKPIVISPNPNSFVHFDHSHIGAYLTGVGFPCITVETGVYLSNCTFSGAWVTGPSHGFFYDDTTSAIASFNVKFENLRSEGATDASKYSIYFKPFSSNGCSIENVLLASGCNGILLRNGTFFVIRDVLSPGTSHECLNVDNTVQRLHLFNNFWNTGSTATIGAGVNLVYKTANSPATGPLPGTAYYTTATSIFTIDNLTINTGIVPDANDGAFLGTGALSFSDLFLASGGVINWNNGNVTLTHSASSTLESNAFQYGFGGAALANAGIIYRGTVTPNASEAACLQLSPGFNAVTSASVYGLAVVGSSLPGAATWTHFRNIRSEAFINGAGNTIENCIGLQVDAQTAGTITNRSILVTGGISEFVGSCIYGATITPTTNDGAALGTGSLSWSDLFLAAGGVINWNNGVATLTENSGNLTYTTAVNGIFTVQNTNAGAFGAALTLDAASASPANSDQVGVLSFIGRDSGAGVQTYGSIAVIISDVTATSEDSRMEFLVNTAGASNTLVLSGLTSSLVPNTSDGLALGTSGNMWSDLFLASGSVINFNAGDVTITHGANTLAFAGASSGYTLDALTTITSTSATAFSVGRQGATNPVLNVNANTASVVTGLNLTGAAAAGRMAVAVTSSGADEGLSLDAKGTGTIRLGATSTGAIEFSRNAVPTTTDAVSLGTTALMWSDLFVATGAVINYNNGTHLITNTAGGWNFSGTSASGTGIIIQNTDTGATGANLTFFFNTSSPAASDLVGQLVYSSFDSTAVITNYANIQGVILDPTNTTEAGQLAFNILSAGSNKAMLLSGSTSALTPSSNDGLALGTTTLSWSDLFIASGGIINFANGDVTVTHASNLLTFAGASSGYYFDASVNPISNDSAPLGQSGVGWSDLFFASGAVINFNAGDVTLTHSTDTLTMAGGGLVLTAGTTAIAPLKFQSGTNLTTAADGAMEFDGQALFFSPDASDRRIVPAIAITRLHAAYTLTSNTNVQKMFNASANGALTLPTGSYIFECVVGIDTMSATSGNAALSIIGAGGATVTNTLQVVVGIDGAKATAGAAAGASWSATNDAPAANTSVVTAGTATEMAVMWKGSFEVTASGTIIPSVDLITANAAVVKIGSYFMCWRMGSATDVTQGNWS